MPSDTMRLQPVSSFLAYNSISDRFQAGMTDEEAGQVLEQERARNQAIQEILNRFRDRDGMLNNALQQLEGW